MNIRYPAHSLPAARSQLTGEYNNFSDVYKFSLDASKSNAIYGRSATVQPAAYYVHIWRRVA